MEGSNGTQRRLEANGRISVLRDGVLVPLLPDVSSIHSKSPETGILIERHTVRRGEVPTHEHKDLCIHLQLSGPAEFEWWSGGDNRKVSTDSGSLILISEGTADRLRWASPSERVILSVKGRWLEEFLQESTGKNGVHFTTHWDLRDASLQYLIAEMGIQATDDWPLGRLYADLVEVGFASHLIRRYSSDKMKLPILKGGLSLGRIRRAMEFITGRLADDLRLEDIARELDQSSFHFAHQFRSSTGKTPYQYLLDQRMDRAKSLLRNSSFSVQAVAAATGFSSPVNFIRTFRQRIGCTPGAWRDANGVSRSKVLGPSSI
ncbi:helix-turn-helix domain-containing protein [Granulicella sp. L60]|uniref:helix-turn-helix domain-containing protein n=1 Tax=Granulicella sp. L60 TaxID=1641866 RepID=UPI00131B97EA|nr:AraC family transcriptional regulator [Granulicella sp. L60]